MEGVRKQRLGIWVEGRAEAVKGTVLWTSGYVFAVMGGGAFVAINVLEGSEG